MLRAKNQFEKTEVVFLGNTKPTIETAITLAADRHMTVKKAIKMLGVHFTCDQVLWRKLNFDEILKTIRWRLHCWNWRNLKVFGRIQIIKSFVVSVYMYRAGSVCIHKDIVQKANKIMFNFIWKGKDKVKRSALIKAPNLESVIRTQRIMCCKKFADSQQSSWKIILQHYVRQVGGK